MIVCDDNKRNQSLIMAILPMYPLDRLPLPNIKKMNQNDMMIQQLLQKIISNAKQNCSSSFGYYCGLTTRAICELESTFFSVSSYFRVVNVAVKGKHLCGHHGRQPPGQWPPHQLLRLWLILLARVRYLTIMNRCMMAKNYCTGWLHCHPASRSCVQQRARRNLQLPLHHTFSCKQKA